MKKGKCILLSRKMLFQVKAPLVIHFTIEEMKNQDLSIYNTLILQYEEYSVYISSLKTEESQVKYKYKFT